MAWLGALVLGLLWISAAAVLWPNVRAAIGVYVGVGWLLLCWFWMARTRTLTLGGFVLLYSLCIPWSVATGLISLRLSRLMPADWVIEGAAANGPSIGIAALTEESLKLLPLALLVAVAARRVRRFAAVDWLLVGFAAGAAFLTAEEVQRRLVMLASGRRGLLDFCGSGGIADRLDCYGMTRFGLSPFSSKIPMSSVGGLFGGDGPSYAGHHVMTALVAAGVGLGVVLWRSAIKQSPRGAAVRRVLGVLLPLAMYWCAVADHVVFNASTKGGSLFGAGTTWLEAGSTIPVPFRIWYYVGGQGSGRTVLLLLLLIMALLCDASRARGRDYWSVVPSAEPERVERLNGWWEHRVSADAAYGVVPALRRSAARVGVALVSLAYLTGRDLRQALTAHARQSGEGRVDALARGCAVLVMQREVREIAADLDAGGASVRRSRVAGLIAIITLLTIGLVAAPAFAASIGDDPLFRQGRWLAGLADGLANWWSTLSPGQQLGLTIAAAFLLAIPFGLGWGLFLAGGLTYLAAHGHGVAALARNPRAAATDYFQHRSPGGMALDAGELALTFVPAGIGSAAAVPFRAGLRRTVREYLDDPAAWRAARRGLLHDERGSISFGPTASSHTSVGFADGAVSSAYQGMRSNGGHAIRHLRNAGLIPNSGSLAAQTARFEEITSPILRSPSKTFDWRLGATMSRGFAGTIEGKSVVVFVAREGPYQGRILSAIVADASQIAQWGL